MAFGAHKPQPYPTDMFASSSGAFAHFPQTWPYQKPPLKLKKVNFGLVDRVARWLLAGEEVAWLWGDWWEQALDEVVHPMKQRVAMAGGDLKVPSVGCVVVQAPLFAAKFGVAGKLGELKFVQGIAGVHGCPDRMLGVPDAAFPRAVAADKTQEALLKLPPDRRLERLKRDPDLVLP